MQFTNQINTTNNLPTLINSYANEGYVFFLFFLKCSLPSYAHEPQQKTYYILKKIVKCMYFYNIQEELS